MHSLEHDAETLASVLHKEEELDAARIRYIMAYDNCCYIFMTDGRKIFDNKTVKHYETIYCYKEFYRIHHKYLINTAGEIIIKPLSARKYMVILPCNTELEISYRRKDGFILYLANRKRLNCDRMNELFVNNRPVSC
ncbi:MAG: LytTR family transcriptional regulator [Bacteroidetes bacterium]|nr:LytTR family transcriptional regulator [Bacteroidota bacterium]